GAEPQVYVFISPVDLVNMMYEALTFRGKGSNQQGYTGADIRGNHGDPPKWGLSVQSDHHGPVGITEYDLGPHFNEFVHKEKTAFEHFLMQQHGSSGLGGHHQDNTEQVGGESGPGMIGNGKDGSIYKSLNDIAFLSGYQQIIALKFQGNPQAFKGLGDEAQLLSA